MNRLDQKLASGHPILACYLPVGDPLIAQELADIYVECGVDIVELGMPSPNPHLDGKDVSASMARSIATGNDIQALAAMAARIKSHADGPACICMCYSDFGIDAALSASAYDNIDGLLMLELHKRPDAAKIHTEMRARDIRSISLISADVTPRDLTAAATGDGYLMLQAASGVTGPRVFLDPCNAQKISRLRAAGLRQKILLGFGIGTAEQAAEGIGLGADGVVIGSMCVRKALDGPAALRDFLTGIRARMDG